jgi:hypothetical protein
VLCIGGYLLITTASRQVEATPPPPDRSVPTAREAYPPAVEAIRAEDPGALLASSAGVWTPVIDAASLGEGRTSWTFHFYLPSSNRMAWVVVARDGAARIVRADSWETPPDLLDDQGWQVDSAQAMQTALQTCQATLDTHPDSVVEARLSMAASNRALVWRITVTPPGNPDLACAVAVDATTGQFR